MSSCDFRNNLEALCVAGEIEAEDIELALMLDRAFIEQSRKITEILEDELGSAQALEETFAYDYVEGCKEKFLETQNPFFVWEAIQYSALDGNVLDDDGEPIDTLWITDYLKQGADGINALTKNAEKSKNLTTGIANALGFFGKKKPSESAETIRKYIGPMSYRKYIQTTASMLAHSRRQDEKNIQRISPQLLDKFTAARFNKGWKSIEAHRLRYMD